MRDQKIPIKVLDKKVNDSLSKITIHNSNSISTTSPMFSIDEFNKNCDYSHVLVIEDKHNNYVVHLADELYNIGRSNQADITLKDESVSRHHGTLVKEYNQENNLFFYKLIDGNLSGVKSKNGVVINGKYYQSKYLEHGDVIRLSKNTVARFFVIDENSTNKQLFIKLNDQLDKKFNADIYAKKTLVDVPFENNKINLKKDSQKIIEYISKVSSFAELSPYPIFEINLQGKLTYYNPSANLLFPNLKEDTMSHPLLSNLLTAEHKVQGNLFVREVAYQNKIFEQYIHYLPELQLIRSYIFDFTQRKKIESQLKYSEEKYRAVVEQTSEGILLFDADDLKVIEANTASSKMLNYSVDDIVGNSIDFFLANKKINFEYKLKILKKTQTSFRQEVKFKVKYNQPIDVELSVSIINYDQKIIFCCVFRDISRRKKLEDELRYQAYYDNLTGLYKRNYFRHILKKTLENSYQDNKLLAVMFIDVDYFKKINDNYGHDIGDLLLKQFANRLKHNVKQKDYVARWGGDEFVILLLDIINYQEATLVAQRLIKSINNPFICNNINVTTSTSIGIALFPEHGQTVDSLIKKADQALYLTKEKGRNGYTIYQSDSSDT